MKPGTTKTIDYYQLAHHMAGIVNKSDNDTFLMKGLISVNNSGSISFKDCFSDENFVYDTFFTASRSTFLLLN